jgi:hypothetical protein
MREKLSPVYVADVAAALSFLKDMPKWTLEYQTDLNWLSPWIRVMENFTSFIFHMVIIKWKMYVPRDLWVTAVTKSEWSTCQSNSFWPVGWCSKSSKRHLDTWLGWFMVLGSTTFHWDHHDVFKVVSTFWSSSVSLDQPTKIDFTSSSQKICHQPLPKSILNLKSKMNLA